MCLVLCELTTFHVLSLSVFKLPYEVGPIFLPHFEEEETKT